jgi:hypothetical protein
MISVVDSSTNEFDISTIFSWIKKKQSPPQFILSTITERFQQYVNNLSYDCKKREFSPFLTLYFTTILKEENSWQYTLFTQNDFLLVILETLNRYCNIEEKQFYLRFLLWCLTRYKEEENIISSTLTCISYLYFVFKKNEKESGEVNIIITETVDIIFNYIEDMNFTECKLDVLGECYNSLLALRKRWKDIVTHRLEPRSARWCRDDASVKERCVALDVFSACRIVPEAQNSWLYQQLFDSNYEIAFNACRAIRKNHRILNKDLHSSNESIRAMQALEYISRLLLSENLEMCIQAIMFMNKVILKWSDETDTITELFQNNFVSLVTSERIINSDVLMRKVFNIIPFFTGDNDGELNFDVQMHRFINKIFNMETSDIISERILDILEGYPIIYCAKSIILLLHLSLEQVRNGTYTPFMVDIIGKALEQKIIMDSCIASEQMCLYIRIFIQDTIESSLNGNAEICSKGINVIGNICRYGALEHVLQKFETLLCFMLQVLELFVKSKQDSFSFHESVTGITEMFRCHGHKLSDQDVYIIKHSDVWKDCIRLILNGFETSSFVREDDKFQCIFLLVVELYWLDLYDNTLELFNKLIKSRFYNSLEYIFDNCLDVLEFYRVHIGLLRLTLATDHSLLTNEEKVGLRDAICPRFEELSLDVEELQVYIPLYNRAMIKLQ